MPCFHASRECVEALNRYCGSSLRPRLHETGVTENDIVFGDSETKYPRLHDRFHIVFPVYTDPPESPKQCLHQCDQPAICQFVFAILSRKFL